uniref:G-protein coupled receptors family 1 profile domain-containing protein n=1 Tax=Parascaris equorum TaxID=6256 RepID=A0A914RNM8_PAREQ
MEELEATRHPPSLLITYSAFYSAVFVLGLLGNVFVVLAVVLHPQLRSSTDYLISSLATADLLIILFCLPTTLLNNLLTVLEAHRALTPIYVPMGKKNTSDYLYTVYVGLSKYVIAIG